MLQARGMRFPDICKASVDNIADLENVASLVDSIDEIHLKNLFNDILPTRIFPSKVQKICFDYPYNQPIHAGVLPSTLKVLYFPQNSAFNHPFGADVLPAN
jgi:hypothetical protein